MKQERVIENYVDPADLKKELKKYNEDKIPSDKLGEMIIKIATKYSTLPKFNRYTYKDEMVSSAILKMVKYLDRINPEGNIFSYLTSCCHSAFLGVIKKETKESQKVKAFKTKLFDDFEFNEDIQHTKEHDEI